MDRDKLIQLIMFLETQGLKEISYSHFIGEKPFSEVLADHLIANGIGDISAEKYRADVAEQALKNELRPTAMMDAGAERHITGGNVFCGCPVTLSEAADFNLDKLFLAALKRAEEEQSE